MAKLFPSKQTFVDRGNGTQVLISDVKILTATSDHLQVPTATDVQLLTSAYRTSDPTFYLTSDANNVAIDGATVGTEYIVVSRHDGMINTKADT
jgi:hypothetical protein